MHCGFEIFSLISGAQISFCNFHEYCTIPALLAVQGNNHVAPLRLFRTGPYKESQSSESTTGLDRNRYQEGPVLGKLSQVTSGTLGKKKNTLSRPRSLCKCHFINPHIPSSHANIPKPTKLKSSVILMGLLSHRVNRGGSQLYYSLKFLII